LQVLKISEVFSFVVLC